MSFAGASSIDQVSSTHVRVNWSQAVGAAGYGIYDVTSGSPVYVGMTLAGASNYTISGLSPSTSYAFRVRLLDTSGLWDSNTSDRPVSTLAASNYRGVVLSDSPTYYWRLGDASGPTLADEMGASNLTLTGSGNSLGATGAIAGDGDTALDLTGAGWAYSGAQIAGPTTFSLELWFKTTTATGGKLIGFGAAQTGASGSYDRHIYMTNAGKIIFGVYPGSIQVITSPLAYNDGAWHQVVATLSAGSGMTLSIDGTQVASNAAVTTAQGYNGYWRVGYDNLNSWTSAPTSNDFTGTIDEVAVYPTALSAAQIAAHYAAGY